MGARVIACRFTRTTPAARLTSKSGKTESREAGFHPNHPEFGARLVPFAGSQPRKRSAIASGKTVGAPATCRYDDPKSADKIAKTQQKLLDTIDKSCTDANIQALDLCNNGVGGTADKAVVLAKEALMDPIDMHELLERNTEAGVMVFGAGSRATLTDVRVAHTLVRECVASGGCSAAGGWLSAS